MAPAHALYTGSQPSPYKDTVPGLWDNGRKSGIETFCDFFGKDNGYEGMVADSPYKYNMTFIYPFFTRGRPFPLQLLFFGTLFCIYNGFLQGYYLIYCAEYPNDWCTDIRFTSGLLLFLLGMGINVHSDLLLRQLRKPGEVTYKIPQGGLFTYVSGANYFGEIVEWFGFAIATWSLPAFAFAFFTLCCIGPRAYHHHRYYLKTFTDYPKSRKALIPFVF
ncbi:PREDICTED: 3-oxo-5-alpha-steroid 4-dehydrogenase 2 [Nipponia nippon]|uniref:3-oxo-5-alpha-steroid 4-dehydrogenase 2 n=1 Tax=Nipponia nippon TaxID=128390 RepID=UPI0005114BE9|nr:PREDICTED: 3-oxo-5-alpha-steroid 4-dehydrogenase 2 [Nipponia nippon]